MGVLQLKIFLAAVMMGPEWWLKAALEQARTEVTDVIVVKTLILAAGRLRPNSSSLHFSSLSLFLFRCTRTVCTVSVSVSSTSAL